MFKNATGEKRIVDSLKALVEEFGHEHVAVYFPEEWRSLDNFKNLNNIHGVKIHFHPYHQITLRVEYDTIQIDVTEPIFVV